ncbi:flagellar hook capping protein [Actinotalea sp. M2MS4P-6]|uniref:flagellar hook assembly protein FlgD n=1 Tax=Actinotalea sp. M2MS4P-6 TaxID=2983762 RepID=UPI0021E41288|nr:flagellar hook capping FlgD N-terminal domain-containing protein [Actinotalea sp. M2MS4P-6]MCV2392784.1 flagellar hook capping protein [Actinotalea sp. M2MS4P-6]
MIDNVTATAATSLYTTGTSSSAPNQTMNQEVFLNLLVAQLRNQDPSSPMDTNEMMAQSTQLASMEQLTSLTEVSQEAFALQMRIAASGLVGQQVSVVDGDGVTHTGIATGVSFAASTPTVTVDGVTVNLDAVSAVATPTQTTPAA